MTDEYNGWTNRETWACNLWLANDEGLYAGATEIVESLVGTSAQRIGEALVEWFRELVEELNLVDISRDIGSWWRVDERELGTAWVETMEELVQS